MTFRIRTKLIATFIALISAILIIAGLVGHYNISASDRAVRNVETIAEEVILMGEMQGSFMAVLMPANDYLITGDRKYIDEFNVLSKRVEESFKKADEFLALPEASSVLYVEEERKTLKELKTGWLNIKELSLKIFSIPDPIGNKEGAMMMEEMDYRWGDPATELIHKWRMGDVEEYKEAAELAEKAKMMSWVIMGSAGVLLLILGAGFALFYSNRFVRPIEKLRDGSNAIAGGDFRSRVDVKTGDEIGELAEAFNQMAENLLKTTVSRDELAKEIEERKRAEAELFTSEERYIDLFENMNDMVQSMTPDGSYIYVNSAWRRTLGYSEEDIKKLTITDVVHPESMAHCMKIFQCLMAGEEIGTCEAVFKSKDGREITVEGNINCKFVDGRPVYTRGIFRDITERKKAEASLKKVHEELLERTGRLEKFQKVTIGREQRIMELKGEVNDLLARLGEGKRYEWSAEQIKEKA